MIVATADIPFGRGQLIIGKGSEFEDANAVVLHTAAEADGRRFQGRSLSGIPAAQVQVLINVGKFEEAPELYAYGEPKEEDGEEESEDEEE